MTRTDLAVAPTEAFAIAPVTDLAAAVTVDASLIERLIEAIEALVVQSKNQDPELQVLTPAEAGVVFKKSENWVKEAIQDRRIPFTYVGKSPRLTAKHIRWVLENGELMPQANAA